MGSAVERLTGLADAADRFAIPFSELRDAQVEAVNERFQDRRDRIKLLSFRAKEADLAEVSSRDDVVPLLFPHSAYKSYPESFLTEGKWDRLAKWLGTVSPYPIASIQTADVADLDDWLERLEVNGNYVSCSSGTTGKSAMLIASERDLEWSRTDTVGVFSWGSGVAPAQDRRMFGVGATVESPKNRTIRDAQAAAFGDPRFEPFRLPVEPITVGRMTKMVVLRKAMAEGTARPEEIADFEATSKEREETLDKAYVIAAERLIDARADKLFIASQWNALYHVAKLVRDLGFSGKDFHPDNCIYVGGGLKRAQLPDDYKEFVHETFHIPPNREFQNYSMQELNSGMPRCRGGGRYHVPPWIVPFILNEEGDALLPSDGDGEVEGRAGFFDLALDGRWGGVITGDKVSLDFGPCACGSAGPSIRDDIVRYAD
jgi:hypothetical protein